SYDYSLRISHTKSRGSSGEWYPENTGVSITAPNLARARVVSRRTSMPKRTARPRDGRIRFVMILIVLDFPAPFGPRNPRDVPCGTVRSRDFKAVKRPYSLPRPSRLTGISRATDSEREDCMIHCDI